MGHKAEERDRVSSLRCSRALATAVQETDNVYQAPQDWIWPLHLVAWLCRPHKARVGSWHCQVCLPGKPGLGLL